MDLLLTVPMAWVEVEDIDAAQGEGLGTDAAGLDRRCVPVLILKVDFDGEVVSEVVVEADAGGVDEGVGAEVLDVAEDVSASEVVDAAATDEEVGVRMETSDGVFHLWADEKVLLAADIAAVDGVGTANLGCRPEGAKVENCDVEASGDAEIFAAAEISQGTCACNEGGELKLLGCGRGALRECPRGHQCECGEQCQS